MKLVTGEKGLDHVIRWVHISDVFTATNWVQGGELLFVTNPSIENNMSALLTLVSSISQKSLAGLVINSDIPVSAFPESIIELGNKLEFPIFVLPWKIKLVEVTQEVCTLILNDQVEEASTNHIIEEILFENFLEPKTIINRAKFYGYDLTTSHRVFIISMRNFDTYTQTKGASTQIQINELKNYFKKLLQKTLQAMDRKILIKIRNTCFVIICPVKNPTIENPTAIAEEILKIFESYAPSLNLLFGIGEHYPNLIDLKKSFKEAEFALAVAKKHKKGGPVCAYKDIGLFKLFLNIEDTNLLHRYVEETLGQLIQYDERYHTDFTHTLQVYLECNENISLVAETMFAHRSTIKYRLKRVEEILGFSLSSSQNRLNINIAFILSEFLHYVHSDGSLL
jgi:sugar diacid utilization regulator